MVLKASAYLAWERLWAKARREEEPSQDNYPGEVALPGIDCEKKTMTAQTSPTMGNDETNDIQNMYKRGMRGSGSLHWSELMGPSLDFLCSLLKWGSRESGLIGVQATCRRLIDPFGVALPRLGTLQHQW